MKFATIIASACLALTLSAAAKAETVASFTTSVSSTDASQLGRPLRNSVPQDWAGTETYPGVNSATTGTTYYYKTFTFASSLFAGGGYLEITDFEPGNTSNYFLSAYANSYDVNNRAANWLGDVGFSGNYQTNDGGDFEIVLPSYSDLVLVLNSTLGGLNGLDTPIYIQVDNYSDANFGEPVAVAATPEPSSLMLVGTGLLTVAGGIRRRFKAA